MLPYFLALLGGVLLYASQPPRRLGWLQVPGLTLFFVALLDVANLGVAALIGLVFALAQVLPTLIQLRLHPLIGALLSLSQSGLWVFLALGSQVLLRSSSLATPLFMASFGAFLTWAEWTLLPFWGTTQAFSRVWSHLPSVSRFVCLTGTAGAPFALFLTASCLAVGVVKNPLFIACAALFVGALMAVNWLLGRQRPVGMLRVATYGWAGNVFENTQALSSAITQTIQDAARQGAQLLVTPEAAIPVEAREPFRRGMATMAARHQIALAIGYSDGARDRNCIDFFDAGGEVQGCYVKTHLVPVFERYTRGNGLPTTMEIGNMKIGGLICQDDNFPDIAARYARLQTQLLAIPTHDWRHVKDFHFVGALWRALEFRCGIAIAATGGISAIVDGQGRLLASCDHFVEGAKLLIADVPILPQQTTPAARCSWLFPFLCGVIAVGGLLLAR